MILLKNVLFARNNDLSSNNENENKKAYATAIEAVIGFISIIDKKCVFETIDRIWDKYVAMRQPVWKGLRDDK